MADCPDKKKEDLKSCAKPECKEKESLIASTSTPICKNREICKTRGKENSASNMKPLSSATSDVSKVTKSQSLKAIQAKVPAQKLSAFLKKNPFAAQLFLGSVSGWTTGFYLMKLGKPTAAAIGGGIILSQIAHRTGYIDMDWSKLSTKAVEHSKSLKKSASPELVAKARQMARTNPYFAAGFVGGFLIGVSV